MEGNSHPISMNVHEVFDDFKGRRAGLIKGLTDDGEKLFLECDPAKENLCLYGFPNKTWKVDLPVEEVPPEIPEPAVGINFSRDAMQKKDWLSLVAVHSDSWLLAVAFYFGARFGFSKGERKRLFQMINELPTIFETVNGFLKWSKDQAGARNYNSKSQYSEKAAETKPKDEASSAWKDENKAGEEEEEDEDENEEEEGTTLCGACGDNYDKDGFWICCDMCERWFHGKCVKITPAKAQHMKQYICPVCSSVGAGV